MLDSELQFVTRADASQTTALGQTLLELNNAHARELSWLQPEQLEHLVEQSFLTRRIGNVDAFLLALDQDANYSSPNFQWFRTRYSRFVYVDRIVVASSARGRGCARRLYRDLFEHAIRAGHAQVFGEVNIDPPNPTSDAFHAASGFVEVGRATVHGGSRTVRYLSHRLAGPPYAALAGGSASTE
jgi:predicted GNAT superfamily acetyltransferase